MKRISIALLSLLMAVCCNDAYALKITGHAVDKQTGEHIAFLTVRVLGSSVGTQTDDSGHYLIDGLKAGVYKLEVGGVGYSSQQKLVKLEQNVSLNFDMSVDALQLDQVVVTGNKSEVKRRNSSTLVSVLNAKVFDMVGGACLADGLSYQPGVRVENDCQNCGFTQVRINGLDGHYSQILMDSRPIYSALTGVYGLEQIPANMIDRVEVIRGGGSALFGSSAIGGTVNIITKDPIENSAELSHTLTSIGVSGALENNTTLNASIVSANRNAGLFVYGQNRVRDGYDHDDDGFTEIAQLKTQTVGFRSFLKTSDESRLNIQYHGIHEYRRGGNSLNLQPHLADVAEQTDHNIHGGGVSYDIYTAERANKFNVFTSFQNTKRNSYYGGGQDPNAYGWTKDFVIVSGGQYTRQWKRLWFMPAELVGGVEHKYNYLRDVSVGYEHDALQKVNDYSAYLQNEWRTDRWGFLIGGRVDKNTQIDHVIFSPRMNLRFNPNKNVNFRLTYSTGFRAPQAYDEDFHVAVVGGERVVTVLAKGLKEESSNSVSASADLYHTFGSVQTNLLIEGFYTDLKDVFALRKLDELDAKGNQVLERYNGSGATVLGLNLEGRAVFSPRTQLQAGLTLQRSRYKQPEVWSENQDVTAVKRMFRTPDVYGYFTARYSPLKPLSLSLTGTYTGGMLVQHCAGSGTDVDVAVVTSRFCDINFKIAYDFNILQQAKLQLNAGVLNVFNSYQRDFDQGADRDSGYIYGPSMPRSIIVGAKITI